MGSIINKSHFEAKVNLDGGSRVSISASRTKGVLRNNGSTLKKSCQRYLPSLFGYLGWAWKHFVCGKRVEDRASLVQERASLWIDTGRYGSKSAQWLKIPFALEKLFKLTVLFASISLLPFYYDQMIQMIRSGEIKGTPTEEPSANVGHVMMECSWLNTYP